MRTLLSLRRSLIKSFGKALIPPSSPVDGFAGFFICGAATLGFPFVPELLAFGKCHLDFHPAIFEIHPGGNQSETLLLGLAD